ncbi:hypothetical protein JCM10207_002125 [Rhodosporidiobolus poonsookiae]
MPPDSPSPPHPTSSFASVSHDGTEPALPVVGRKTGCEGWINEGGQSLSGAAGEGGDEVGAQLAWRMKSLELNRKSEDEGGPPVSPQASPDPAFPSIALGGAPHFPASESRYLSTPHLATSAALSADYAAAHQSPTLTPSSAVFSLHSRPLTVASGLVASSRSSDDGDGAQTDVHGDVEGWRASLQLPSNPSSGCASFTPSRSNSLPRPVGPLPPFVLLPPQPALPVLVTEDATPLADPLVAATEAAVSTFSLFHCDPVDPQALPLPAVPDDYIFPDQHGRASFSRTPPPSSSSHPGWRKPVPGSPALKPVLVFPSPPSAFSTIPTPSGSADDKPPGVPTLQLPPLTSKPSNPDSLLDLYRRGGGSSSEGGPSPDDALERAQARIRRLEGEVERLTREGEQVGKVNPGSGGAVGAALEAALAEQGLDASTDLVLLLPSSLSRLSTCPRCARPLSPPSPPEPSYYYPSAVANHFLRSDEAGSGARAQLWADEHWDCLPWLAGGGEGVRVVRFGRAGEGGKGEEGKA